MKSICVNYVTYPERAEENKQFIQEVFKELHQKNIAGIKYAVFKMEDNVFIHLAQFENEEAHEAFRNLPAFQAFQKNIYDRLSSKPISTPMKEIGSFLSLHTQTTEQQKNQTMY